MGSNSSEKARRAIFALNKAWFPYGLCGSLWVAEGRTVLGKTVKDHMETQLKDRQRPSATLSDP